MPSDVESLLGRMRQDPWFRTLEQMDQDALLQSATLKRLRVGEYVFRKGDPADGFYGLVDGVLKVSTLRQDGKEGILVVLESGRWFGEASSVDRRPRTHDVSAIASSDLLVVEPAAFDGMMKRSSFARAVALLQATHIRAVYSLLEDATLRTTRARIARRLLRMAQGDATLEPLNREVVTVTQDTLAMMLGITRQTLAIELKAMAAGGAITMSYGRISIASMERLSAIDSEP